MKTTKGKKQNQATAADPAQPKQTRITVELPEILDQVPYHYSNHARLSSSKWDVRLAFGEIGPTGKLEPKTGVILPHVTAKALHNALGLVLKGVEAKFGHDITDPDQGKVEVNISQSGGRARLPGEKAS